MIQKEDVIAFFDACAASWDAGSCRNEAVIAKILDNAGVREGVDVLDVACGTGVLLPDYLKRGAGSILAVDISHEMIRIAREKFSRPELELLCADAELLRTERRFDAIVVYNAFPHFTDPDALLRNLAGLLKPGGRLTVAHGASRRTIDAHHANVRSVSMGLMPAEELAERMGEHLSVELVISDDEMYQVVGRK